MFTILVGTDESGSIPLLLHEEDALPGGPHRWRLVARTDDPALAERVMHLLYGRCFGDPPDGGRMRAVTPRKASHRGAAPAAAGPTLRP